MIIPSIVVKQITEKVTKLVQDEAFILWGVNDKFKRLNNKLDLISGVLEDAEEKELNDVAIRRWLDKLRDVMYDINDIIDDFNLYQAKTMEEHHLMMRDVLSGKHVLLVLDDLWSDRVWNDVLRVPFQRFTADTRVLITTRDEGIARQMKAVYTHQVKVLPDEDGWSLLRTVVRRQGNVEEIEELKDVGMNIVEKCKGLPLAIKVIGGVLSKKRLVKREWQAVLLSNLWSLRDASAIMSALRLSYMDLPSELKPCFLTYSLFPEDYVLSRTRVTQMWVAEGLVKETDGDEQQLEDFAASYHDELVSRSLLHVVGISVDPRDDDVKCKMHDLVRELAISMTRGEHIVGRERQQDRQQESVKEMEEIPERVKNEKCRLRSLLVFQSKGLKAIPPNLYNNLKFLHILDLSNTSFDHLPDSIGELVHLRYLNLYNTSIVELPNSICNLRQVQTLILLKSKHITKIPKELSQMQELRHLEVDSCVDIPEGIGKLTNLRTLRDFTVRNRSGQCNIEELISLSKLRYLVVQSLDKVPGPTEARGAVLDNKTHLRFLALKCSMRVEGVTNAGEMRRMEEVLQQLHPHESLETLFICDYYGRTLPTWMSMTPSPLEKLDHLELNDLCNLQRLPSLGNLPKLRVLRISHCNSIKTIGTEFVFDQEGAFPKLQFLSFNSMPRWEEWNGGERTDIFPRLKILELVRCPVLKWIPRVFARPDIKVAMGHFSPLLLTDEDGNKYGNEFTGLFRQMLRRS
ncbi:putative disease resistance RPP13-like protein 1 [Acorus gramineus]|uniref:Disease resistance RPP13-like protein 1 n=1 Tax=Acorus gramineus TaxID=55184 RepID=A0AAV9B8C6_ACOGR|nr:putative disease resistance RPP13-like protein 1 [Acorus gramineus]